MQEGCYAGFAFELKIKKNIQLLSADTEQTMNTWVQELQSSLISLKPRPSTSFSSTFSSTIRQSSSLFIKNGRIGPMQVGTETVVLEYMLRVQGGSPVLHFVSSPDSSSKSLTGRVASNPEIGPFPEDLDSIIQEINAGRFSLEQTKASGKQGLKLQAKGLFVFLSVEEHFDRDSGLWEYYDVHMFSVYFFSFLRSLFIHNHLQPVHFDKQTWCDYCHELILGLGKQGVRCNKCRYTAHLRCQDKVLYEGRNILYFQSLSRTFLSYGYSSCFRPHRRTGC